MIKKTLGSFVLLTALVIAVGFIVLAVWDVPVEKKEIEKSVDTSKILENKN